MKTLYIFRHAKAEPEGHDGDAERPLMKRGQKAAAAMGEYLAGLEPPPRLVLCSTSLRTRETLDAILPTLNSGGKIIREQRFLDHSEARKAVGLAE